MDHRKSKLTLLGGLVLFMLLVVLPVALVVPPAISLRQRLSEIESLYVPQGEKETTDLLVEAQVITVGVKKDLAAIVWVRESIGRPVFTLAGLLPVLGPTVRAGDELMYSALYLLETAEEVILAGQEVLLVKQTGSQEGSPTLIPALKAAGPHIQRAAQSLRRAEERLTNIKWGDLPAPLGSRLEPLARRVPSLSNVLQLASEAVGPLPRALGENGEKRYLILAQDHGELRSTGGYMGNYGILTVKNGQVQDFFLRDVMHLDLPFYLATGGIPLHPVFMRYLPEATWWGLRDSNLSPHFPASAKEAERLVVIEGGAPAIDGVVAITVNSLSVLLKALGPVQVPEFGETVTADNAEQTIRYYQNNPPPVSILESYGIEDRSYDRKLFTSLLAQAVFKRLSQLEPGNILPLLDSWEDLLRAKDIQAYFNDPDLQKVSEKGGFDGQIKRPWGDYLFIVDSNLSGNKANLYVKQSVRYQVLFKEDGRIFAQLAIHYDYTNPGNIYPGMIKRDFYGDYLRVYVPYGSEFLDAEGVDQNVEIGFEEGKTVLMTFLKIRPGTEKTVVMRYMLPFLTSSWIDGGSLLDNEEGLGRYELTLQKQAGTDINTVQVEVELPGGVKIIGQGPFQDRDGKIVFESILDRDLFLFANLKGL